MPVTRDFSSYFTAIQNTAEHKYDSSSRAKYQIENVFKPVYKNGRAEVVMRFLPSHPNEFKPFIENRTHMYEYEPGKFFGCACLEKFGQSCPICDHNHKLYTCGKYTKEEARPLRISNARRRFVSNIYIVKNENAPETEGKVYRFEYGVQIMDMIRNAMQGHDDPEEGHVDGFNPFDWKTGANFIYIAVQGTMGPKLDSSRFGRQRPISDGVGHELTEAEINEIESKLYTLDEYEKKVDQVWNADEIRRHFVAKIGHRLFDKFDGTKDEVPVIEGEDGASVQQTTTAAVKTNVADIITETAEATKQAVVQPVSTQTPTTTASEDDFFASLENT